jgi:NADH:ubiquinone oxidoreductase subunit 3 (subunit A)
MENILLSPPIAFLILLAASWVLSLLFIPLAYKPKAHFKGERESYACGEETYDNMAQPDYSQFFPFAFFFTIAHVATLIVATIPAGGIAIMAAALIYVASVVAGISILLWKE